MADLSGGAQTNDRCRRNLRRQVLCALSTFIWPACRMWCGKWDSHLFVTVNQKKQDAGSEQTQELFIALLSDLLRVDEHFHGNETYSLYFCTNCFNEWLATNHLCTEPTHTQKKSKCHPSLPIHEICVNFHVRFPPSACWSVHGIPVCCDKISSLLGDIETSLVCPHVTLVAQLLPTYSCRWCTEHKRELFPIFYGVFSG